MGHPKAMCVVVHRVSGLGGHLSTRTGATSLMLRSRGWGWGRTYLGSATVTLLPTLHKHVPTHRASHQPVRVRGIGQAARLGFLQEHL